MSKKPQIVISAEELEKVKNANPEAHIFSAGAKYFEKDKLTENDLEWLGQDYDVIYFNEADYFMPELAFFFANKEYREKLSAKQILEAVAAETEEGNSESAFEFEFSAMIEQELRRGNEIIICPFDEAGQQFKRLLNDKYRIKESFIVDDEKANQVTEDGISIITIDQVTAEDMSGRTVIVNDPDYEKNLLLVYKLNALNKHFRIISPFGAFEMMLPGRRDFIEQVRKLTEVKKPITDKEYVRIGADGDGGYILLEDFDVDMAAYSFGINDDVTWDKQMAEAYDMDIFMYDHTIEGLPEENSHFHYYKKGIAGNDRPEESLYSLRSCLEENNHLNANNLILKMDVEGAEWEMLNATPSEILGQFRQIAFELHDLDHPEKETEILNALEKLNKTHFPVWIHGNNHVSAICTEDIVLPVALEILYINKECYEYEEAMVCFPWQLDNPNTYLFPEYILGNWGKRNQFASTENNINDDNINIGEGELMSAYETIKKELLNDIDFVASISDKLLGMLSVFGPKERVHLATDAEMQNAVINTMSGQVYVGSNTFCGHNVSIITGSHDAYSCGESRKKFPDAGNDIVIGNGVWICSNAVILGPCRIGNNAVIAAGSIVLPGTEVADGELWAGVPAIYKKKVINTLENAKAPEQSYGPKFDTIVVITPKDYMRVESNYKRLVKFLPSDRLIFVGNSEVGELVKKSDLGNRVGFICEDDILPFDEVNAVMYEHLKDWLNGREMPRGFTGWYYQQFLKMQYAYITENQYYMSWDGDTIPCKRFEMFKDDGTPFIDYKHEYHAPYFETMGKLIPGLRKFIQQSFISEHMLFNKDIMRNLIETIERNDSIPGEKFYEKIIHSIEPKNIQDSYFSEFETYGSFVCLTNPSLYRLREWHSFRLAGEFFDPDKITDSDYEWLSNDFEAISFEKGMSVREDHKNLFDNKEYQAKLSARQMLEIAQEEFKDGYIEVWS